MFNNTQIIRDARVALENATVEELTSLIAPMLGSPAIPGGFMQFTYDIMDYTDAYDQWDRIAAELGIVEGSQFHREFDIRPFAVNFIISAECSPLHRAALPYLSEWTARRIAVQTKRRTLLTFNGGEIPYRLFQNKQVAQDFRQFYEPILGPRVVPEFDYDYYQGADTGT